MVSPAVGYDQNCFLVQRHHHVCYLNGITVKSACSVHIFYGWEKNLVIFKAIPGAYHNRAPALLSVIR